MTPSQSRFNSRLLLPSFAAYSVIAGIYTIGAALLAAFILARHLNQVQGRALRIALSLIALGTGALGPVVAILTLERLTHLVTPSRAANLRKLTPPWENLHKRVVEIHDSIHHLLDCWATPDLLDRAGTFAAVPHRIASTASILETACWLEVTRRLAASGAPKQYCVLHPRTNPISTDADSTKPAESADC